MRRLDARRCSPSSTEATCCAVHDHAHHDLAVAPPPRAGVLRRHVRPVLGRPTLGLAGGVGPHASADSRRAATLAAIREPMIPRPRKPIFGCRSPGIGRILPHLAFRCAAAARPPVFPSPCPPARSPSSRSRPAAPGGAAVGAARCVAAALGDQRVAHLGERLQLAYDAVASAVGARAARAATQPVVEHPQREFALERLDRRVQRVAHRDVHGARAVGVRARALAAADRLVVGERPRCRASGCSSCPAPGRGRRRSARGRPRARRSRRCPPPRRPGPRVQQAAPRGTRTSSGR